MAPEGDPSASYIYLVTARHNVERARRIGSFLYVRLNRKDRTAGYLKIDTPWMFAQKEGVDLAVAGPYFDLSAFDSATIPVDYPEREGVPPGESIGIGDEVFCIGLFTQRYGSRQNQPIVRSGIIAAMPTEALEDAD